LSDALTDAKQKQADATDAVAEAIERETEALDNYREAIKKVGETQIKYPKVVADNPMTGIIPNIPIIQTGNSTGFNPNGSPIIINVNAGLVSTPDQIAQELSNLSDRYRRLNGGTGFF
jgi:uncharacterized membrane protein YqiK